MSETVQRFRPRVRVIAVGGSFQKFVPAAEAGRMVAMGVAQPDTPQHGACGLLRLTGAECGTNLGKHSVFFQQFATRSALSNGRVYQPKFIEPMDAPLLMAPALDCGARLLRLRLKPAS